MARSCTYGYYSLLVLYGMINEGGSFRVNLTEVAKRYMASLNETAQGKINSWGLTSDYAYWTEWEDKDIPPVSAEVEWMIYGDCNPSIYKGPPKYNCTGFFSWSVHDGIVCPFALVKNISLPVKYPGLAPKNISLVLNHLPEGPVPYTWGPPGGKLEKEVFSPICRFVAKISFDGYLVYLKNSNTWVPVGVSALANIEGGLVEEDGKLTYHMWGVYFETMWCY